MTEVYHATQLPLFFSCQQCGNPFVPKAIHYAKFCSRKCFSAYRTNRPIAKNVTQELCGEVRTCGRCHIEKPIEKFAKDHRKTGGREYRCKECRSKADSERWHRTHTPKPRTHGQADAEGYKVCVTCKERKPLDEFMKSRTSNGRGAKCLLCYKEYAQENNAKFHAEHTESIRDRKRSWGRRNKGKVCEYAHRRRARIEKVAVEKIDYKRILARDGYVCHICGGAVAPNQLAYEHVIPLSRGGSHSEDNIKVSHRVCNNRKCDKLVEEMTPYQRRGITHQ